MFIKINLVFRKVVSLFLITLCFQMLNVSLSFEKLGEVIHFSTANANSVQLSADRARTLYYYIAGAPSAGYPSGQTGPNSGLLNLFSSIIEDPAINPAFASFGVFSCQDLPLIGEMSVPTHTLGPLSFEFAMGKKRTPVNFVDFPERYYDRRIIVRNGTAHVASLELICPGTTNSLTGYLMREEGGRRVEVFFQNERNGDRRQVDAYMDYPSGFNPTGNNEKVVVRFDTRDGVDFQIWGVKTTDSSTEGSFGVALRGDTETQQAEIITIEDVDDPVNPSDVPNDSTVEVENGFPLCVNLSTDVGTTGCASVEAPANDVKGGNFSISATSSMIVETPELLVTDQTYYNLGNIQLGSYGTQVVTVTNPNAFDITSLQIINPSFPFEFTGGTYPGVGGTCSAVLTAGASCLLEVGLYATTVGANSGFLELTYILSGTPYIMTISLLANAISTTPAAQLEVAGTSTINFGTLPTNFTGEKTVSLVNVGGEIATGISASGLALPFGYKGGAYPGIGGTCGLQLVEGQSCILVLEMESGVTGSFQESLVLTFVDSSGTSQTFTKPVVAMVSSLPAVKFFDGQIYDFGSSVMGQSVTHNFDIINQGDAVATSIAMQLSSSDFGFKGGAFPGTGGTCGATLAPNTSCTVEVEFLATTTGVKTGSLGLSYSSGAETFTESIALEGFTQSPAFLVFNQSFYNFGSVDIGQSSTYQVVVSNVGPVAAQAVSESGLTAPFGFTGGVFPGTGGTCSATIPATSTCIIEVEMAPTAPGSQSSSLMLSYNDGLGTVSSSMVFAGSASGSGVLTISETDPYDYGAITSGNVVNHTFTLTNGSSVAVTGIAGAGLAAPYSFLGGTFPGTGGDCTASLPASGTCDIVVEFAPMAAGVSNDTIEIAFNDGISNQTVTRDVPGNSVVSAVLTISEAEPFDYGGVVTGNTVDHTFTVFHAGTSPATSVTGAGLLAPFEFSGSTYPGVGGTCTASIGPGTTCTIVVSYSPTTVSAHTDTIELNYNDGSSAQMATRSVQGTGGSVAVLTISETDPYVFGDTAVGGLSEHTFTIANSSSTQATAVTGSGLLTPYDFKGGGYPGQGGTCGATIAGLATCTVVLTYAPTSTGSQTDTLDINYNNGTTAALASRAMTGTGVNPALLSISASDPYDFGSIQEGQGSLVTLTVTNSGDVDAIVTNTQSQLNAPFDYVGGPYPGTGGTCGAILAPAGSCDLVVSYTPDSVGAHTEVISIDHFDGVNNVVLTFTLQGNGTTSTGVILSESDPFYFGELENNSMVTHLFVLSNNSGGTITAISGASLTAPFSYVGGTFPGIGGNCSATLPTGATCTIEVEFAPVTAGSHSASLDVNYDDGAAQVVSRSLVGASDFPAVLNIADGPTYDFGSVTVGNPVDKVSLVTNTGGVAALNIGSPSSTADFNFKGGVYPGTGGTCGTSLPGGSNCTVVFTFNPTTTGALTGVFQFDFDSGTSTLSETINLQGTGL